MFLLDGTVVTSASDLTSASSCEFAFARAIDVRLGRIEAAEVEPDAMLARTSRLGDAHELRVLEAYRERFGAGVVEVERPDLRDPGSLEAAVAATGAAFASGAAVVFQATFFDGSFVGFADFIVRTADGRYRVQDTKLARHAKVTALLQLAAYAEQLDRIGVRVSDTVELLLGDGSVSEHRLGDILPVYRRRRGLLGAIIEERLAAHEPVRWGDPRYAACGRCDACEAEVQSTRDVLLVAGLRVSQRARLRAAGVTTIDALAAASGAVDGISDSTLAALRQQATLQLDTHSGAGPAWTVINPLALAALPAPDDGDIFFDFEGDPLHQDGPVWGLDYLFGLVETDTTFRAFWAHDLAEERRALDEFLAYVTARRAAHPGMHVYHYAAYERTHLLSLAARHGVGEEVVDDLLRNNVLVDLYPVVKQSLRIGSRSYSLKKLEPLYMDQARQGVDNAADSIAEYVHYQELRDAGEPAEAAVVLDDIARYNAYDCVSTLRLRDWLLARATENAVPLATPRDLELDVPAREPDPVYLELVELLADTSPVDRTTDQTALALASAAIDYHRRELKSFWWDHFNRLATPVEDWADTRDVFVVSSAGIERDWYREGRQLSDRRLLRLTGTLAPGSSLGIGGKPFLLYDAPYPPIARSSAPGSRTAHNRAIVVDDLGGSGFLVEERLEKGAPRYSELPMALTPATPPDPGSQVGAISEWGREVLDALPRALPDAALDILRRVPPRGALLPVTDGDTASAIRDTLLGLDRSYLAVQGPPGTGKTFTGSRVIADLVANHGWRVGVVAQSHASVQNMLEGVVKAGLDPELIGKKPKGGDEQVEVPWTGPTDGTTAGFGRQSGGFVLGGTAWTFSNAGSVPRGSLDLLVVDEAGQYSLASTIAAAVSAQRLLLLGDPQQLPQVSQGTHPEPVDVSALGWLADGHQVLPPDLGYFLDTSWRMHPAVCAPVSALSYEGKLFSHPSDRRLHGVEPGLHPVAVPHVDNSTSSTEEADAVVALVRDVIGRPWASGGTTAPLAQDDVIVVAPYNAQVALLRTALTAAGLGKVAVGTVDRFQGKEAAVSIVSLAASSADDVPRGLEFLLLANRLNVAISRAQWAAYLVYSPALTEYLPPTPEGVARLSAFITLVELPAAPRTE
ncbi:TM0106 family RecB-like putative nuclease [Lacisediminihabitans profunda]|uniref:TM0106 family RecB-like putative nuclease n=1 Tax=Lacisediminihabitans profunda TaxID=2594790 RepID=A0A5C8UTI1_9MICO|nr:bifunctional RecB family nuclease/DEAD/DEAH box helicase [Lacisediminihabitans profunda]TXN31923.1 TM0106 family RecB-like putative nuclease [Lacisediminihabitans profunda]